MRAKIALRHLALQVGTALALLVPASEALTIDFTDLRVGQLYCLTCIHTTLVGSEPSRGPILTGGISIGIRDLSSKSGGSVAVFSKYPVNHLLGAGNSVSLDVHAMMLDFDFGTDVDRLSISFESEFGKHNGHGIHGGSEITISINGEVRTEKSIADFFGTKLGGVQIIQPVAVLNGFDPLLPGPYLYSLQFFGTISQFSIGGDAIQVHRLQADPVPEPTSMLLFGSGLVGALSRRKSRDLGMLKQ